MKETHYKLKHRVTALFAAAVMLCSMLPGAAFAEEPTPQPTEETMQMEQQTEPSETDNGQTDESSPDPGEDVTEATPETAEEQPAEEEISAAVVGAELYTDLPDAPIGSYIGSEGLPVATGETKIGICEWPESQLEETSGSYLTAVALDNDGLTMAAPLLDGADYAIVPILAQVEYPADSSSLDLILPDGVTLLDYYGEPAKDAESLLHNEYSETSAAVLGVYVQADANFTAQLVYTAPDGSTLTKTLQVTIDRKYPVLRPPGKERFVRFKTLGKRYTPEAIQTRILYPQSYHPYVENPRTIKHGRLHSGKKPRRKLTGLRALYYRYLYELGALPRKPRRPSYAVRQDAYKLDLRIRQMEFLSKHNIDTLEQLETHRKALQTEIGQLQTKRKQLPKTDDVQLQCESVHTALKQLRQEERLCRKIAEHSLEVQQHLTEARRDRAEQQKQEQERARDRRPDITTR